MNKKKYTQPSATIVMLDLDSDVVTASPYNNVETDENTDLNYDQNKTSIWDNAW